MYFNKLMTVTFQVFYICLSNKEYKEHFLYLLLQDSNFIAQQTFIPLLIYPIIECRIAFVCSLKQNKKKGGGCYI